MSSGFWQTGADMRRLNDQRGVTLIELMMVVAIVGLMAVMAYPAYTVYVERTQTSDGRVGLLDAAQRMERCFAANGFSYEGCDVPERSPEQFYALSVETTATTFTVEAEGVAGRVTTGSCSQMSIDHRGARTPDNDCW